VSLALLEPTHSWFCALFLGTSRLDLAVCCYLYRQFLADSLQIALLPAYSDQSVVFCIGSRYAVGELFGNPADTLSNLTVCWFLVNLQVKLTSTPRFEAVVVWAWRTVLSGLVCRSFASIGRVAYVYLLGRWLISTHVLREYLRLYYILKKYASVHASNLMGLWPFTFRKLAPEKCCLCGLAFEKREVSYIWYLLKYIILLCVSSFHKLALALAMCRDRYISHTTYIYG